MSPVILIAGAGQLGSRYLQGLANCLNTLDIYVKDNSEISLQVAKERLRQCVDLSVFSNKRCKIENKFQHKIIFIDSYEKIPKKIDIAIISTNADVRAKVVEEIVTNFEVKYWILEKILAQSDDNLNKILALTKNSVGAWTNTPRRMMVWHQCIRKYLPTDIPLKIIGSGNLWGLACNGIHFLDLASWWTGETLKKIDISELDTKWTESKRKGFFEISGKMKAIFSGKTTFTLESKLNGPPLCLKIRALKKSWEIDESNGVLSGPKGLLINGNNEMQSFMTTKLVDTLLNNGNCDLPKLSESAEMHRIYLRDLLIHWNKVHGCNVDTLPIT